MRADGNTWEHLNVKVTATGAALTAAFATMPAPTVTQTSPCVIDVVLAPKGKGARRVSIPLVFPVPVAASRVSVKFSRKRFFVDVYAPPARTPDSPTPFPVVPVITAGDPARVGQTARPTQVMSWALPRVPLPLLPTIAGSALLHTIARILPDLATSPAEQRAARSGGDYNESAAALRFLPLKQTIQLLLVRAVGAPTGHVNRIQSRGPMRWFSLNLTDGGSNDLQCIMFIAGVRATCDRQTAVLDACVHMADATAPVSRRTAAMHLFVALGERTKQVPCKSAEMAQWRRLVCAAAESARAGWTHRRTCEYVKAGSAPVALGKDSAAMCACGEGVALPPEFLPALHEAGVAPAQMDDVCGLFTRIALPAAIFAPSSTPSGTAAKAAQLQREQAEQLQRQLAAAGVPSSTGRAAERASRCSAMLDVLQQGLGEALPLDMVTRVMTEVRNRPTERVSTVVSNVIHETRPDSGPASEVTVTQLAELLESMAPAPMPAAPPPAPRSSGGARAAPAVPPRRAAAASAESASVGCARCGASPGSSSAAMLRCGRCKKVRYCDRACQKAHWKKHRNVCSKA